MFNEETTVTAADAIIEKPRPTGRPIRMHPSDLDEGKLPQGITKRQLAKGRTIYEVRVSRQYVGQYDDIYAANDAANAKKAELGLPLTFISKWGSPQEHLEALLDPYFVANDFRDENHRFCPVKADHAYLDDWYMEGEAWTENWTWEVMVMPRPDLGCFQVWGGQMAPTEWNSQRALYLKGLEEGSQYIFRNIAEFSTLDEADRAAALYIGYGSEDGPSSRLMTDVYNAWADQWKADDKQQARIRELREKADKEGLAVAHKGSPQTTWIYYEAHYGPLLNPDGTPMREWKTMWKTCLERYRLEALKALIKKEKLDKAAMMRLVWSGKECDLFWAV